MVLTLKLGGLAIAAVCAILGFILPSEPSHGKTRRLRVLIFLTITGLLVSFVTTILDDADQNNKTRAALERQQQVLAEISRSVYSLENLRVDVQINIPVNQPHILPYVQRIPRGNPTERTITLVSWLDIDWPDTAPNPGLQEERGISEFVARFHPTISFFNPEKIGENEPWGHSRRMIVTLDTGLSRLEFPTFYANKDLDGQKASLDHNTQSENLELVVRSAEPRIIREAFYLVSLVDFRGAEVHLAATNSQRIQFSVDHITLRAGPHGRLRLTIDNFVRKGDDFVSSIPKDAVWR